MNYKEIANRFTGFSTPIFGIQWTPKPLDIEIARTVINYLEDKRVLYNSYELENPYHCLQSVIKIREFLTEQLNNVERNSNIDAILRGMRTACRKLTDVSSKVFRDNSNERLQWKGDEIEFYSAVGILRGTMGVLIGKLLIMHGLDCEDVLLQIVPLSENE